MKLFNRKICTALTVITLGVSLYTPPAYAGAIPVIDTQNIAQQAKTLAEAVKIVTTTAQQVQLQLQELKSWPEEQLKRLTDKFDEGVAKITTTLESGKTGLLGKLNKKGQGGWDESAGQRITEKYLKEAFPEIGTMSNATATTDAVRAAKSAALSHLSQHHIEVIQKYAGYGLQVEETLKEITNLVKQSDKAIGAKQSAQIANKLTAFTGKINGINAIMTAITGQQEALKEEAEIQNKKNEEKAVQARIEASHKFIEESHQTIQKSAGIGESGWIKEARRRHPNMGF